MRKLGIMGGTFDPIHHGHLVAAGEACYQLGLDQVFLVPAGQPPHKTQCSITPAAHRLRMVELAISGRPYLQVSRVDIERSGPSYTVDTMRLLSDGFSPDVRSFFIEGVDSLADLTNWYQPDQLMALCEFAVVKRPGIDLDLERMERRLPGISARVHWVRMPRLEISSSDLRNRIREGRPVSYLLPPEVEAYIEVHGLYRT